MVLDLVAKEKIRENALKEKGYDAKSLETFRRRIKNISVEEAKKLGIELLTLVNSSKYKNNEDVGEATKLVLAGANVEVRDERYGDTGLIKCAKNSLYKTFSLYVKAGADINAQSKEGTTSSSWSARRNCGEILEDLILLQADLNIACIDGDTALFSAARNNSLKCLKLLRDAGANLNSRNMHGELAIDIAGLKGTDENITAEIRAYLASELGINLEFTPCSEEDIQLALNNAKDKMKTLGKLEK